MRLRASRPQRIATSGSPSRCTSARIACSVTTSQPLPRDPCYPARPSTPVEQQHAPVRPGGEVARGRGGVAEVAAVLAVDVGQRARRARPHVGRDGKRQPDGVARRGIRSWPTISTRTSSKGRVNARSTFAGREARRPAASSARKNSPICRITGSTGPVRAHPASTISDNGFPVTWVLPVAHAHLGTAREPSAVATTSRRVPRAQAAPRCVVVAPGTPR